MNISSHVHRRHPAPSACRLLLYALLAALISVASKAQSPFPDSVRRVVFLGNSITYAGTYVTYVDAYLSTRYPQQGVEFINVGLPSETVSGLSEEGHAGGKFPRPDLHERLERVLTLTKPDLVLASYGMNDGIYLPFDEGRFQQFKDGINWLHSEVVKTGAQIIHLTPPVFDELRGHKSGYAAVLDRYSDWLINQKTAQNWSVIDVHYPMKRYLEAHRKVDSTFALADDGVHPGEVGHWLMARSVLLGLGQKAVANAPTIQSAMTAIPNSAHLLKLISERQFLMKDAWLTATGHKRPGMKIGIPLEEAREKAALLESQIKELMR
ncbi:SGNH/GDSL hydrolase family protein [Fibrella forsythiae]|uniref:SGNH/GDSL hydrolase family protein n=1 Tax=Fibrella forsythiae TaxID=2817061 RepID=A0ABS3JID5_9BACT|nr:SGNH/GDSL hydrolase family protein [Fibrella forsythiae]MBO0949781.1 SGNH/GDSL hydrolase family protein [Fibrella forsythiae]